MTEYIYNEKISKRANACLNRRRQSLMRKRRLAVLFSILMISVIVILGSSMKAFATSSDHNKSYEKYYMSIQINKGDTLWSIANTYNICSDMTNEQYIKEIKDMNQLKNDEIHTGQYLVISYFDRNE